MASTIKVNSITAQSGLDVNIPTGFKLKVADAGELYVGGAAITTGATQVTSRNANTTIGVGSGDVDITGKSMSVVSVDASSGTSATITVTLPAASTFGTTAIQVVSAVAHGAGNKIVINKHATDGGGEVYTLYNLGDHCELVSDGTSVIRTGNEFVTIRSQIALTANVGITTSAAKDVFDGATSSNYTVVENIGSGWNSTSSDFIAPHAGLYRFGGHTAYNTSSYIRGWGLKKNTAWVTNIGTGINFSHSVASNIEFPMSLAAGDSIEFWIVNHSGSHDAIGAAAATDPRCRADCWMLRRY
tara:strand:+ start:224 stop:1126 length:903 start_codon:yes stop_codon:yes gene_type:complete